jgi:hypothetical protein
MKPLASVSLLLAPSSRKLFDVLLIQLTLKLPVGLPRPPGVASPTALPKKGDDATTPGTSVPSWAKLRPLRANRRIFPLVDQIPSVALTVSTSGALRTTVISLVTAPGGSNGTHTCRRGAPCRPANEPTARYDWGVLFHVRRVSALGDMGRKLSCGVRMDKPKVLAKKELQAIMPRLSGWKRADNKLSRTFEFRISSRRSASSTASSLLRNGGSPSGCFPSPMARLHLN